ncbi:hypothetical protein Fcan01_18354 [Folsomia candida]|uniref:Uncharacterized protein n=1 Tax=Folsomia candida TaxID=158441 RepID=A0A226DNX5_FOLCA|nr:hypothetical protein Fcan01_18354 [Folsomia candida]
MILHSFHYPPYAYMGRSMHPVLTVVPLLDGESFRPFGFHHHASQIGALEEIGVGVLFFHTPPEFASNMHQFNLEMVRRWTVCDGPIYCDLWVEGVENGAPSSYSNVLFLSDSPSTQKSFGSSKSDVEKRRPGTTSKNYYFWNNSFIEDWNPTSNIGELGIWSECDCRLEGDLVIGFGICIMAPQDDKDNVSAVGFSIICKKGGEVVCVDGMRLGVVCVKETCSDEFQGLCGVKTQVQDGGCKCRY